MATKTRNISLPPAADSYLERCIRRYGNASSVVQAGLRALEREEMGALWREWQEAKKDLPQDPLTPEIEQRIESRIRAMRRAEKGKAAK